MLWASDEGLTGSAEPAEAGEELDAESPENTVPANEAENHHTDAVLSTSTQSAGVGMFSKLILFGIIVGVVAIFLKNRKSSSGALSDKSLA